MKKIIKDVITSGGYKLSGLQHKIKKLYILGDLTEAEMDELLTLASSCASADAERPETLQMIQNLSTEIEALKCRVKVLEGGGEEPSEYSAWIPWDGISMDYENGAVVSHNGELWQSVFNGQNVWEPGIPGTDDMWHILEHSTDDSL